MNKFSYFGWFLAWRKVLDFMKFVNYCGPFLAENKNFDPSHWNGPIFLRFNPVK